MYELISLKEEINQLAQSLINNQEAVFDELSLSIPKLTPAELGLLRTVSWLYVLYNEVGKVNVGFLVDKLSAYGIDPDEKHAMHFRTVRYLRTFFQHHLNLNENRDANIREACQHWFDEQCRTALPREEAQWKDCLIALLNEAVSFLRTLELCIDQIKDDESSAEIVREWEFRRNRYHPPFEFDKLIEEVAADMGRENIDATRLRNHFYDEWVKELELRQGNYDFKVEARKLIEHALLSETTPVLPITGYDIMKTFNIKPDGKLVNSSREHGPSTRINLVLVSPCSINYNKKRKFKQNSVHFGLIDAPIN